MKPRRTTPRKIFGPTPALVVAVTALTAVLAGACGGANDAPSADPADEVEPRPTESAPDLQMILDRPYERDETGKLRVLDDIGEPPETSVRTMTNRHDPSRTDTLRTLRWPALELEVHVAGGKEILSEVRVTDEGPATAEGLSVGLTRDEVRNLLGEPRDTEDGEWTYELFEDEHDPLPTMLDVGFDGDRVTSLTWTYYVD